MSKWNKVKCLLMLLIGFGLCVLSVSHISTHIKSMLRDKQTQAVIFSFEPEVDSQFVNTEYLYYVAGKYYMEKSDNTPMFQIAEQGKQIPIYYNPVNPANSYIYTFMDYWGVWLIIGLVSVFLLHIVFVDMRYLRQHHDKSSTRLGSIYISATIENWSQKAKFKLLLIIALISTAIVACMYINQSIFIRHVNMHTEAMVTGYYDDDSGRYHTYYVKYQYYDQDGVLHRVISNHGALWLSYHPGDKIHIIYDAKNKYATIQDSWLAKWGSVSVVALCSILFWWMVVSVWLKQKRSRFRAVSRLNHRHR